MDFIDVASPILADKTPDHLIRVYPYELVNTKKSKAFIQNNTISLVGYSQFSLIDKYKQDENGNVYFEMLASINIQGKLDIAVSTSTFGQELKYEHQFKGITNSFIDHRHEKAFMFTIGEPFDEAKYEAGEISAYLADNIIPAQEYTIAELIQQLSENAIEKETLTEIDFIRVEAVEAQYTNARIIFTTATTIKNLPRNQKGNNGISLEFENHMLLNFLKAKGETLHNGETVEFGEIDLISEEPLMPVKMSPFVVGEKVEMLVDWYDYDQYMPYVTAATLNTTPSITSVVKNDADVNLIKDMLIMSYGFASNWASAPVIQNSDKGDNGKIDPTFRITSKGIKVTTIAGQSPIQVIDGIYERHLRENPGFLLNKERYQIVRSVLNGLSRYIYSSYVIGKGMNAYNQAMSPWFLDLLAAVSFEDTISEKVSIKNPDAGSTGNVDTRVLKDVTVVVLSQFFTPYFTDDVNKSPAKTIELPTNPNLSASVLIQTDRKINIPNIKDTIDETGKPSLPGDVDTKSNQDLKYLWWLPIQDDAKMKSFFLDALVTQTDVVKGQQVQVNYPNNNGLGDPGRRYSEDEVRAGIRSKVPGDLVTPFSKEETKIFVGRYKLNGGLKNSTAYVKVGTAGIGAASYDMLVDPFQAAKNSDSSNILNGNAVMYSMIDTISGRTGWGHRTTSGDHEQVESAVNDGQWFENPGLPPRTPGTWTFQNAQRQEYFHFNYGTQRFSWTLVTEADVYVYGEQYPTWTVTASGGVSVTTTSFTQRQIVFDKQQWRRWLAKFNILTAGYTPVNLKQKEDFTIQTLEEIIIGYMWGNKLRLAIQGAPKIEIPMFNKDDETNSVLRILFT